MTYNASKNEGVSKKLRWMYFFIKDDDLLEKHNTFRDKVSADIEKEFHRAPVYNEKILRR